MLETRPDPSAVRAMFGRIAKRYDRANTVLSFGIHHRWRREVVRRSGAKPGDRVLDCATGTGDLAFAFARAVLPGGEVIGSDFCPEMLVLAREKGAKREIAIRFDEADVLRLPYADARFDVTSIAFGVRNVPDPVRALSELRRVTRPGGTLVVLEFGERQAPLWRHAYSFFSRHCLPRVGGWVTGERSAYEYLQRTSSQFPCGEAFLDLLRRSGEYRALESRPLSGGIAYLYRAVRA